MNCRQKEESEHGKNVDMNQTAKETIKLYHDKQELEDFLESDQAKFWADKGFPFQRLSVEECLMLEPLLASDDARHRLVDNSGLVGGVLCGQGLDSSGDVHLYTCNIAQLARDHGVDIRCGVSVEQLVMESGDIAGVVTQEGDTVTGDHVSHNVWSLTPLCR